MHKNIEDDNVKRFQTEKGKDKLNDDFELDVLGESHMSEFHMHVKDGKTAQQIARIMKIDLKTVKVLMKGMKESLEPKQTVHPTFAGVRIFKVKSEEYCKCLQGRRKHERYCCA